MRTATETVVALRQVWKIFGTRASKAMQAVKDEGIGKPEVLQRFGCVVGVQGASFEVARGEIFCIMGLSGSGCCTWNLSLSCTGSFTTTSCIAAGLRSRLRTDCGA